MRRPSIWTAVAFGVVAAAATLTRVTSLLVWLPGLAMFVLWRPAAATSLRRRATLAGAGLLVATGLIAPI